MSFKVFLLCLVIVVLGFFIYLKTQSLGSDSSYFNRVTRYKLGRYGVARAILGLHKDGDARTEYLKDPDLLTIEVVHAESVDLPADVLDAFASQVEKYTLRNVRIVRTDTFKDGTLTEKDMDEIVNQHRRHVGTGESNLFVMYAQDFVGSDSEIGRTYKEFGIVLSADKINQATAEYPESRKQYIESTLLHEFGHQVGLDHNKNPNCIMNEEVETPTGYTLFGNYTQVDFCPQELDQLNALKLSL